MTNRGIRNVRAQQISTPAPPPRLAANADNRGADGVIDLIDCTGSFGTLSAGGPEITTGTGGNVRYIHTTGLGALFRDRFFGGGAVDFTRLPANESFRYTDASGQSVKVSPLPIFPLGGDTTAATGLAVQTYGIRDKGGSVLVNVGTYSTFTSNGVEQSQGIQIDSGT